MVDAEPFELLHERETDSGAPANSASEEEKLCWYRMWHKELLQGRTPKEFGQLMRGRDPAASDSDDSDSESDCSSSSESAPTLRSLACLIFTAFFSVLIVVLGSWCLLPAAAPLVASAASSVHTLLFELGVSTTWVLPAQTGNLMTSDNVMIVDCGATKYCIPDGTTGCPRSPMPTPCTL